MGYTNVFKENRLDVDFPLEHAYLLHKHYNQLCLFLKTKFY